MKEFAGKVAVITGAASGLGRSLAERCARNGMKVVLADVEAGPLARVEEELKAVGTPVLAQQTDVSKAAQVEALANRAFETFGEVNLLFNNAGVAGGGLLLESTLKDWEWVMGVNLWGVIYGLHYFLPRMVAQKNEGHVINTASMAGLIAGPYLGIYKVTKHGVVSLSETLSSELALSESKIKVSVVCPSFFKTQIYDSSRNRPLELQNNPGQDLPLTPEQEAMQNVMRQAGEAGGTPEQIAEIVFQGIEEDKLYILPHPEAKLQVQARLETILE